MISIKPIKSLLAVLLIALLTCFSSRSIHASNILFSENFNDGNSDGWEEHSPWGFWQVQGSEYKGSATYLTSPALPSYSLNGQPDWTDYLLSADLIGSQGIDKQILFRVNNAQNRAYIFNFRSAYFSGGNDAILAKRSPIGSEHAVLLQSTSFISIPNVLYHINVLVENLGTTSVHIKISVNHEDVIDYIDQSNPILSGKIGLEVVPGGYLPNPSGLITSTLYDNITVSDLSSTLPVPDLKQYTEPWGSMIYDTANIWSPGKDSIARYGCALTSATMILQYYGYTVTPDSLNTWLLNNHGYVRDGLVDWSAITKWVKLNHDINPLLTKLEYSRSPYDSNVLATEIDASRPAIVKLVRPDNGTHFVVAKGKETSDFDINDPATAAGLLSYYPASQYSRIDKFTPSNTDLSYLYFYTSPNVHLDAFDTNGFEITTSPDLEGPYIDQTDQTLSLQNGLLSVVVPKPKVGQYIFRLSGNGDYTTETRIYDIDANLTNNSSEGSIKTGQIKTFVVNIGNTSQSNEVNFEFIRKSINDAYLEGSIHTKGVYSVLIALLHAAEEATHQSKNTAALKVMDNLTNQVEKAGIQINTDYATKLQQYIGYLKESL